MEQASTRLVSLRGTGGSLEVLVKRQADTPTGEQPWFDAELIVDAPPFSGTVTTVLTLADLQEWAASLRRLDEGLPGRAVLGGDRSVELSIGVERQVGRPEGALALLVELTPSGDDPFPLLRFLIFDAAPFWADVSEQIHGLS